MTTAQWMFHYLECIKFKKQKSEETTTLFKALLKAMESFAFYSHPNINLQKLLDEIEKRRLKEIAPQMEEEATAAYDYAMSILPKSLSVVEEKPEKETFLPQTKVPKSKYRNRKKKSEL